MQADWLITSVTDHGAREFYRYSVSGENLNYPPEHMNRRFSWRVPDLNTDRYAAHPDAGPEVAAAIELAKGAR